MKSLDEFVELFAEQFDDTDSSEITALKGDDVKTSVTIEDLYNKVIAKL